MSDPSSGGPGPASSRLAPQRALQVRNLSLALRAEPGRPTAVPVLCEVSFDLWRGRCLGLVGESGSGKSLTALALIGLLPPAVVRTGGRVELAARPEGSSALAPPAAPLELTNAGEATLDRVRGRRIGMVFQEPMSALNPVRTVGSQLIEVLRHHEPASRGQARAAALRLLDEVAIAEASRRLDDYPHQLSGGQRQRVLIAMALAGRPEVLLADEPTTALDVTVQAQIVSLLETLMRERELALLLVSHDFGVVARLADRIAVMYAGQLVEAGSTAEVATRPGHPYARALLAATPRLLAPRQERLATLPGAVPRPGAWPTGCSFHPRCALAVDECRHLAPPVRVLSERVSVPASSTAHWARCVLAGAPNTDSEIGAAPG